MKSRAQSTLFIFSNDPDTNPCVGTLISFRLVSGLTTTQTNHDPAICAGTEWENMNGISHVLESKDKYLNIKRRGARFPRTFMFIHQLQLARQKPPIPNDSTTAPHRTIHDLCRQSVLTTIINRNTFSMATCGKSHMRH